MEESTFGKSALLTKVLSTEEITKVFNDEGFKIKKVKELKNGIVEVQMYDKGYNLTYAFINPESESLSVSLWGQGDNGNNSKDSRQLRSLMRSSNPPSYSAVITTNPTIYDSDNNIIERSYDAFQNMGINVDSIIASGYSATGYKVFSQSEKFLKDNPDYNGNYDIYSIAPPKGKAERIKSKTPKMSEVKSRTTIYVVGDSTWNESSKSLYGDYIKPLAETGFNISVLLSNANHSAVGGDVFLNGLPEVSLGILSKYGNSSSSSASDAPMPGFKTIGYGNNFTGVLFNEPDDKNGIEFIPSTISNDGIVSDDKLLVIRAINLIINSFNSINFNSLSVPNDPIGISGLISNCVNKYNECGATLRAAIAKAKDDAMYIGNIHETEDKELAESINIEILK